MDWVPLLTQIFLLYLWPRCSYLVSIFGAAYDTTEGYFELGPTALHRVYNDSFSWLKIILFNKIK